MPTYDLTCEACGHRFERFVARLLRDGDRVCPSCEAPKARVGVGGGYVVARRGGDATCAPTGGFG